MKKILSIIDIKKNEDQIVQLLKNLRDTDQFMGKITFAFLLPYAIS